MRRGDLTYKYKKAVAFAEKGDYPQSIAIYESLLKSPDTPSSLRAMVYNDLGELSCVVEDFARAERLFMKAIFEDILLPSPYWNLIRIKESELERECRFSVIIPTYNRCSFLKVCVESLRKNSYFPLEIIMVADPCSDGTMEYLEQERDSDDTVVIINEDRIGPSESINKGVRLATGHYVSFLNDDMVVMPGWDLFVVLTIGKHKEVGCGVPLVIYPDGRVQSAGQHNPYRSCDFDWIGRVPFVDTSLVVNNYIRDFPQFQIPREVDYGYVPVMRRECFDKVGFVDERFERYFIDPDQGYRIQQAGYKNVYCPVSVVIHYELSKNDMASHNDFAKRDLKRFGDKWKLYSVKIL